MILFSCIINTLVFFMVLNYAYIKKKRQNPEYPDRPLTQLLLFPLLLGIIFTILVDALKGVMYYQIILFTIVAVVLYWLFFKARK